MTRGPLALCCPVNHEPTQQVITTVLVLRPWRAAAAPAHSGAAHTRTDAARSDASGTARALLGNDEDEDVPNTIFNSPWYSWERILGIFVLGIFV